MSEVAEQRTSSTGDNATTTSNTSLNNMLKKLTSGSSWVSPFRGTGSKKNLRQQLKEENSISNIHVPKKFTSHPTLAAEQKDKKTKTTKSTKSTKESVETKESKDASTRSLKDEPIDTPKDVETEEEGEGVDAKDVDDEDEHDEEEEVVKGDNESERPLSETEKEDATGTDAALAGTDDIEKQVKDSPLEIVTQPESKYVPIQLPNQDVLDKLKDKPKMLSRYQELNATAIGSVSRTLDDPNKVIDLGSGMKMKQQQLLDIAAKRVAPVISSINDEVSKTRDEDEIKRQKELSTKVEGHEKKLQGDFDKYVKKLGKQKTKFTGEIEKKLEDLKNLMKTADLTAGNFEKDTKQEIETANKDLKEREASAVEKHDSDKETLLKNHEELESTKKQELEDAKANQENTTQEIEELQTKKSELDNANSELSTKIEELTGQLNEKTKELDDLKAKHTAKTEGVSKNLASKEQLDTKIATAKKELSEKKKEHDSLSAEVGVLGGTLASYASKLADLDDEHKNHSKKLQDSKKKYQDWEQEKETFATDAAREHERKKAQQSYQSKEAEVSKKDELSRGLNGDESSGSHQFLLSGQQSELTDRGLDDEKKEKERLYNAHTDKGSDEAVKLQNDIEALKSKQNERAQASKSEADQLAEAKLAEIERLDKAHDERIRSFKEKLESEEAQKAKLIDEVANLNKIKQLREEKARLTSELSKDNNMDDINKLIEERELEVSKLSKQIELDGADLNHVSRPSRAVEGTSAGQQSQHGKDSNKNTSVGVGGFLPGSKEQRDVSDKNVSSAVSKENDAVDQSKNEKNSSRGVTSAIATGAAGVGAVGGAGAGAILSMDKRDHAKHSGDSEDVKRTGSLGKLKSFTKKFGRKRSDEQRGANAESLKSKKVKDSAAVNKGPNSKVGGIASGNAAHSNYDNHSESSYETYSIYEEVSESEYQSHLGNPNYMEMTNEEFEKHRHR